MTVEPEQPVQDPLGAGPVDAILAIDGSEAAAAVDPGGKRRADAARLLQLLMRPGGFPMAAAIAGDLTFYTVPTGTSAGLLARPLPGAVDYDKPFTLASGAFGAGAEPYRPKVVLVLTASDVPATYASGHLMLTRSVAGHRFPVVAIPFAAPLAAAPGLAGIARDTGGFVLPANGANAIAGDLLEAWARLHGGRRSQTTPLAGSRRKPGKAVVRGQAGKALRIVVTWDAKPLDVSLLSPAGKPIGLQPFGRGVVAIVRKAKAGAYRLSASPKTPGSPSAVLRGALVATVG